MGATFARIKSWITGETLTASDLNAEFNNILNNFTFSGMDDASADNTAMRATEDPYPGSVESLATDGLGELKRLRYLLVQINGTTYWYQDPPASLTSLFYHTIKRESKGTSYAATATDYSLLFDCTSGALSLTLPTAASIGGKRYIVKKSDSGANTLTIQCNGAETIDGVTTYVLTKQHQFVEVESDGANWRIVAGLAAKPVIIDYTNATHDHSNAANGGTLSVSNSGISATAAIDLSKLAWTTTPRVFDDFGVAAVSGALFLSEYAWTISGVASVATGYGESGFVLLGPADATGNRFGISNLANKPFKLSGGNTLTFECRMKMSGLVAPYYYFGLMDADDLTGNGMIIAAEGTSAIRAKNALGGTVTNTDTGLTWTANTTYTFKIVATASQILFYVDGVLKATHTTNIPTAAMAVCLFIRGTTTACAVDYVDCTSSARV